MFIMRLDDASEHMNYKNWMRMKQLLDEYDIKPLFGIIPKNEDPELMKYDYIDNFWELVNQWKNEGWIPALHGYRHVFDTTDGGINPVNRKSEFAGLPLDIQKEKIKEGYSILVEHDIRPNVFFAPAHTFDEMTLFALYKETDIRIISDTIASDIYYKEPFYFIPQQSGSVRMLPLKTVTFCYHPNTMSHKDFEELADFLYRYREKFLKINSIVLKKRRKGLFDKLIEKMYFNRHIIKDIMERRG